MFKAPRQHYSAQRSKINEIVAVVKAEFKQEQVELKKLRVDNCVCTLSTSERDRKAGVVIQHGSHGWADR